MLLWMKINEGKVERTKRINKITGLGVRKPGKEEKKYTKMKVGEGEEKDRSKRIRENVNLKVK